MATNASGLTLHSFHLPNAFLAQIKRGFFECTIPKVNHDTIDLSQHAHKGGGAAFWKTDYHEIYHCRVFISLNKRVST